MEKLRRYTYILLFFLVILSTSAVSARASFIAFEFEGIFPNGYQYSVNYSYNPNNFLITEYVYYGTFTNYIFTPIDPIPMSIEINGTSDVVNLDHIMISYFDTEVYIRSENNDFWFSFDFPSDRDAFKNGIPSGMALGDTFDEYMYVVATPPFFGDFFWADKYSLGYGSVEYVSANSVPEPSTMLLLGSGLLGLFGYGRRRMKK